MPAFRGCVKISILPISEQPILLGNHLEPPVCAIEHVLDSDQFGIDPRPNLVNDSPTANELDLGEPIQALDAVEVPPSLQSPELRIPSKSIRSIFRRCHALP